MASEHEARGWRDFTHACLCDSLTRWRLGLEGTWPEAPRGVIAKMPERIELRAGEPSTEYSIEFLQGMVNRMLASYHRYGAIADAYPWRVDALASLRQRLSEYRQTGNTEFLIDAANFAMIEFMHPSQPDAHFTPTDSHESPGRVVTSTGMDSQASNEQIIASEEF